MSDTALPPVEIRAFRSGTASEIVDLIVGIQNTEFGVAITAADQPDLADIDGFYRVGAGEFWTASVDGAIIGTIALKAFDKHSGALRKMFVAPAWRGRDLGVGARLLATLLSHARAHGLVEIYLGTTENFKGAHRFYEKNGFVEVLADLLPHAFPRMPLDTKFYRLDLTPAAS